MLEMFTDRNPMRGGDFAFPCDISYNPLAWKPSAKNLTPPGGDAIIMAEEPITDKSDSE